MFIKYFFQSSNYRMKILEALTIFFFILRLSQPLSQYSAFNETVLIIFFYIIFVVIKLFSLLSVCTLFITVNDNAPPLQNPLVFHCLLY